MQLMYMMNLLPLSFLSFQLFELVTTLQTQDSLEPVLHYCSSKEKSSFITTSKLLVT